MTPSEHMSMGWSRRSPRRLGPAAAIAAAVAVAVAFAFASAVPPAVGAAPTANDPFLGKQWGLAKIGAQAAWGSATGAGIKIGIVDSGIDLNHEDLAAGGKIIAHADCVGAAGDPSKCKVGPTA